MSDVEGQNHQEEISRQLEELRQIKLNSIASSDIFTTSSNDLKAKRIGERAFKAGYWSLAREAINLIENKKIKLELLGNWIENRFQKGDTATAWLFIVASQNYEQLARKDFETIEETINRSKSLPSEDRLKALHHALKLTENLEIDARQIAPFYRVAESLNKSNDFASSQTLLRHAAEISKNSSIGSNPKEKFFRQLSNEFALAGKTGLAFQMIDRLGELKFYRIFLLKTKLSLVSATGLFLDHNLIRSWFKESDFYGDDLSLITQWGYQQVRKLLKDIDHNTEHRKLLASIFQPIRAVEDAIKNGDLETALELVNLVEPFSYKVDSLKQLALLAEFEGNTAQTRRILLTAQKTAFKIHDYLFRETELMEIARLLNKNGDKENAGKIIDQMLDYVPLLTEEEEQAKALLRIARVQIELEDYSKTEDILNQARLLAMTIFEEHPRCSLLIRVAVFYIKVSFFYSTQSFSENLSQIKDDLAREDKNYRTGWFEKAIQIALSKNLKDIFGKNDSPVLYREIQLPFSILDSIEQKDFQKALESTGQSDKSEFLLWMSVWLQIQKGQTIDAFELAAGINNHFSLETSKFQEIDKSLVECILGQIVLELIASGKFDDALKTIVRIKGKVWSKPNFPALTPFQIDLLQKLYLKIKETGNIKNCSDKLMETLEKHANLTVTDGKFDLKKIEVDFLKEKRTFPFSLAYLHPESDSFDQEGNFVWITPSDPLYGVPRAYETVLVFLAEILTDALDFTQAKDVASKIQSDSKRSLILKKILKAQLAGKEFEAAWETVEQIEGSTFKADAIIQIALTQASRGNYDAACQAVDKIDEYNLKVKTILEICEKINDVRLNKDKYSKWNEADKKEKIGNIASLNEFLSSILDSALIASHKIADTSQKMSHLTEISRQWVNIDNSKKAQRLTAQVYETITKNPVLLPDDKEKILARIVGIYISIEKLEEARETASALKDESYRNSIYKKISEKYSSLNQFSEALTVAAQIDGEELLSAIVSIITAMNESFVSMDKEQKELLLKNCDETIEIINRNPENNGYAAIPLYSLKAVIAGSVENHEDLFKSFTRLFELENSFLEIIFSSSSENSRLPFFNACLAHFYLFLSFVFKQFPDNKDDLLSEAYSRLLQRKALLTQRHKKEKSFFFDESNQYLKTEFEKLNDLKQKLNDYQLKTILQIAIPSFSTNDSNHSEMSQDELENIQNEISHIELELSNLVSKTVKEDYYSAITARQIADILPQDSVLIDFIRVPIFDFEVNENKSFWSPARYFAFVLPAKNPEKLKLFDLGDAREIDDLILKFRQAVSDELSTERFPGFTSNYLESREIAAAVSKKIITPLWTETAQANKWFILPDGALNTFAFELIPVSGLTAEEARLIDANLADLMEAEKDSNILKNIISDRYIIDFKDVSYLTSARDILAWDKGGEELAKEVIVVTNVDYDFNVPEQVKTESGEINRDGFYFQKLAASRLEADGIVKNFPQNVIVLEDKNALKEQIKKIRSPKILHFATHGFYLDIERINIDINPVSWLTNVESTQMNKDLAINPFLQSGIVLAGVNAWLKNPFSTAETDNGILTGEELSNLNLSGTKLVVLSACETGLGTIKEGDGIYGLRRALILAGAESAIVSLWKIPDRATAEIMEFFYDELNKKNGRSEALKNAKSRFRNQNRKIKSHFALWGGFILEGNPNRIS